MKYLAFFIFGIFVITSVAFSQSQKGNGNIIKKDFQISNVEKISNLTSANIIITQSGTESMTVELDENLMQFFEYKGSNNHIEIHFSKNKISPTKFNVYLNVTGLRSLENTGSGNISTTNTIKSNEFDFEHTGSGNSDINVSSKSFKSEVTGSGNTKITSDAEVCSVEHTGSGNTIFINENKNSKIKFEHTGSGNTDLKIISNSFDFSTLGSGNTKINGSTISLKLEASGSGDVIGESFISDNCNINMYGSGNVEIGCNKTADIEIMGSGDLSLKGDYKINKILINGSGKLKK